MRIREPGHKYEFDTLDNDEGANLVTGITFVNREKDHEHPGTQTQDVLRALIDRTMHCDNCIPWDSNQQIIHHMRMAIAYHEARVLERKAEKGLYFPELIAVGEDGHFLLVPMMSGQQSKDSQSYHVRRYGSENPSLRRT